MLMIYRNNKISTPLPLKTLSLVPVNPVNLCTGITMNGFAGNCSVFPVQKKVYGI
jgi:hypothetical protein